MNNYSYLFKYVIVGDSSVGKSCLLLKFVDKRFRKDHDVTIGVEFGVKYIELKDKSIIKLQIWDTAGQEYFKSITRAYYRGSIGALLVYDISNRNTFNNIVNWIHEIQTYSHKNTHMILIGNKSDLQSREVSYEDGEKLALEFNMLFIETSALSSHNVDNSFIQLSENIYDNIKNNNIIISHENDGIKLGIYNPSYKNNHNENKCCMYGT